MNNLKKYKYFTEAFDECAIKQLGYTVTVLTRNRGTPFAFTEYTVQAPSIADAADVLKSFTSLIPALDTLLGSVIDRRIQAGYILQISPDKKFYIEKVAINISRGIRLGLFSLNRLTLTTTTTPSAMGVVLSGVTVINRVALSFTMALKTGETTVALEFNAPGNISFGDAMGFILGKNPVIDAVKKIIDIRLTALGVTVNYTDGVVEGATARGSITLLSCVFDIFFSYPGCIISGRLTSRPSFEDIAASIGFYPAPLRELRITEGSLTVNPATGGFSISAAVGGNVEMVKGLSLNNLALRVRKTGETVSAFISGSFQISARTVLSLSGEIGGTGFNLKGGASFNGSADEFWKPFEAVHVPSWLTKIKPNHVSIEYNCHKESSVAIGLEFEANGVVFALSIDTGKNTVSGVVRWGGSEIDLAYVSNDNYNLLYGHAKAAITASFETIGIKSGIELTETAVARYNQQEKTIYSLAGVLGNQINFSDFPIVGKIIAKVGEVKIDNIKVGYNSAAYDTRPKELPLIIETKAGAFFSSNITGPGLHFIIDDNTEEKATPLISAEANEPAENPQKPVKWMPVNVAIGPVRCERIGVIADMPNVSILLDGGLKLGCFDCKLLGFSVTTEVSRFKPMFNLNGLSVGFKTSVISISGSISKGNKAGMKYYYSGALAVQLSKYGLLAAASMGETTDGHLVFDIILSTNLQLAVAPAIMITELKAAFGYNEKLTIPTLETLDAFPLLPANKEPIAGWVSQSPGEYWGAAGVGFHVANILKGKIALLAGFGQKLSFDLLGKAEISLPMKATPDAAYLYAEMNILASLKPDDGVFALTSLLSDKSFLLSRQCKLTGGLAFNLWFGNHARAGEFVFTLGGYHPAFVPPPYYPSVPRVGILWNVSKELSVKGEAYLALTPSCVMAGGRLEAVFQSGPVRAWFITSADFLMTFHPFTFDALIKISVGAAVRIKIWRFTVKLSLSAGADLHLYGPPTGGTAVIHLSVLTFKVKFGSPKTGTSNTPLVADAFRPLLPDTLHNISVSEGLLDKSDDNYYVNAFGPSFYIASAVPFGKINIRPMNIRSLESVLQVTVKQGTDIIYNGKNKNDWHLTPVTGNVPGALWGEPLGGGTFMLAPAAPNAEIIPGLVVGYMLTPPPPQLGDEVSYTSLDTSITVHSYLIPSLKAGSHIATTRQNVVDGLTPGAVINFTVQTHGEIAGRYPAPNTSGEFAYVLPHVIFSAPSYPFEGSAKGSTSKTAPWITLITLSDLEFSKTRVQNGVISFESAFIKKILPSHEDTAYFTHVRRTNGMENGVVFANRFPKEGELNHACLLALDDVDISHIPEGTVSFTLLDTWNFFASAGVSAGFGADVRRLSCENIATHITLDYADKKVICHGLFTSGVYAFTKTEAPRFSTSRQAIICDASGLADFSYAVHFENARLQLLADSAALHDLFNLRARIAKAAMEKENTAFVTLHELTNNLAKDFIEAVGKKIDIDHIDNAIENTKPENIVIPGKDFDIPQDGSGNPSAEVIAFANRVFAIVTQTVDALPMLFPDAALIPMESVRFFHVDKNIVGAALDGVFSVGVESPYEELINNCLYAFVSDFIFNRLDGALSGFVLHSSLLQNRGDVKLRAFDMHGTELALFEARRPNTVTGIYVYKGEIAKVAFYEPPGTLNSGLTSEGALMVKSGAAVTFITPTDDCIQDRVVSPKNIMALTHARTPAQFALDFLHTPEIITLEVPK